MFCPQCGKQAGAGAAFCAHCGCSLAATQSAPSTPVPSGQNAVLVDPFKQRKAGQYGVIVAVVVCILLMGALAFSGVLKFGAKEQEASLRAQGSDNVPLIKAQGSEAVGDLRVPGRERMPDDVRAWLEHLRRCEEKRVNLSKDQIMRLIVVKAGLGPGGMAAAMKDILGESFDGDSHPPTEEIQKTAEDLRKPWTELVSLFNSVVPPAECERIRAKYDIPLRETGAQIADVDAIMTGSQNGGDPTEMIAKLNQIFDDHKKVIDIPANETDAMVAEICNKYGEHKWFSITGNVGGGAPMSAGGF